MLIDRDSDYRVVLVALRIYKTGEDLGCRNHILILDVFVIKKKWKNAMDTKRKKSPSKTEMKKMPFSYSGKKPPS